MNKKNVRRYNYLTRKYKPNHTKNKTICYILTQKLFFPRSQCKNEIVKRYYLLAALVEMTLLARVCHVQTQCGYAETHNEIGTRFFTDIN